MEDKEKREYMAKLAVYDKIKDLKEEDFDKTLKNCKKHLKHKKIKKGEIIDQLMYLDKSLDLESLFRLNYFDLSILLKQKARKKYDK